PLPYPALWAIQRDRMRRQLRDYLHDQQKKSRAEAAHFELGFATERFDPSHQDPASTPEAVSVDLPSGPILLRGKIDRVDRLPDSGATLVVDYKTGRLPTNADLDAGRNLQMPLYAAAAEKLLGVPCVGGAFHSVPDLKQVHFSRLAKPPRETREFNERLSDALATADGFVQGIRAGRFDALPSHKCPHHCPYRRICQYAEPRARLKAPPNAEGRP
ncbi:MAG TPA: hypothetical protein DCX07_16175, partial [Phycisphaerales bacterium]|nr:hypothetical protein [Phycisphaerales bacterium]